MRANEIPDLTYANNRLKKYAKQFNRLVIEDEVLLRNFYDNTGKIKHKQFCVPKHLWNETIYRVHNSMTGGHDKSHRRIQKEILLSRILGVFGQRSQKLFNVPAA